MQSRLLYVAATVVFVIGIVSRVDGQMPEMIDFQGSLADIEGNPVNGEKEISFRLYSSAAGGEVLWIENRTVTISDGIYSITLGKTSPISQNILASDELWLGITVENYEEMSPRTRIVAVPYALRAKTAESLVNAPPVGSMTLSGNANDEGLKEKGYKAVGKVTVKAFGSPWENMDTTGIPNINLDVNTGTATALWEWTGSQLILMGQNAETLEPTGGVYDPSANEWSSMNTADMPDIMLDSAGGKPISQWMDSRMFLLGADNETMQLQGGLYNPTTDEWTLMDTGNIPNISLNSAIHLAAGSKIILLGRNAENTQSAGGIFDPSTEQWTSIDVSGMPNVSFDSAGSKPVTAWTGSEMILLGYNNHEMKPVGGVYDPTSNAWTTMNTSEMPNVRMDSASERPVSVWTGSQLILVGKDTDSPDEALTGGLYDPESKEWSRMDETNMPDINLTVEYSGERAVSLWTGSRMILWNGSEGGALYDPVADEWSIMEGLYARGNGHWTGAKMIIVKLDFASGLQVSCYDPQTDEWRHLDVPFNVDYGSMIDVWTGKKVLLVGTNSEGVWGALYDPSKDAMDTYLYQKF